MTPLILPLTSLQRRFLHLSAVTLLLTIFVSSPSLAGAFDEYFKAVKMDDVAKVDALFERGLDPNTVEEERFDTGLILALREGSMKVFDRILKQPGVNLEAQARNGDTAIMIAAYKGNVHAARALLSRNVKINRPGWTALHYAAASGSNEIVKMLLDQHAYIDAESPNKTTPIMMAALEGHIWTVKLLLDEGADITLKNNLGMTAVDFAEKGGHPDIVEGLVYQMNKKGIPR